MKKLFRSLTAVLMCIGFVLPIHALSVEQAIELLDTHYIDDLPPAAYQAQTLDELLAALNDPYTVYLSAEEYRQFLDSINDEKTIGIGVSIQEDPRGIFISSVLEDTPAQEAGLEPGDIITTANGVRLTSTEVATAQLTGEEGTAVTIRVLKQNGIEVELELIRRPFSVATTVRSGLSNNGNAGLILCTSFGDETPKHFTEVITKYEDAVNTWIIDLSGNPGGTSTSGSSAAGRFVGSKVTFYLRDGEDYYRYGFTTDINPRITDHPAILLTTGSTASSAELFSAAIRDYEAGIAVGQRTFGKGIAQQAFDETAFPELFDGDALKMTTYRFFSPDGATNDGLGILPTLMISYENIYPVALLLSAPPEGKQGDLLDLDIAGSSFCIDLELAASEPYRSAFTELLEALPPSAKLYYCKQGQDWQEPTPAQLAQQLGLTGYTPRTFSDAAHSPYLHSINTLAVYGLVGGYGDGTFRPDAPVTRAEFCAMLTNLFGLELPPVSRSAFSDVNTASWYAPAVHAMHDKGYLTGYEDGSFRPDAPITQEEALCILAKATTYLNMFAYNIQAQGAQDGALDAYGHYSDWARPSAWLLDEFEVSLSGVQPQETASRALAAELLCRILTKTGVLWD